MKKDRSNFSATEYSAQRELARIRNTFSFRFGLLVTESFVRKPWMIPLFPFRFIGLFLSKPEPQQIEYKNLDGPETYILFSTSEEGLASVERSHQRARKLESKGINVVHITSSNLGAQILQDQRLFTLPDPKNKSAVKSTSEWNEVCLNFLHHVVMSNNVSTLEFDGPYPYRGVLNMMKIHPHINTVWKRLATKIPTNSSQTNLFDKVEIIDVKFNDFSKPKSPIVFADEEPKSIFFGLGYDHREGISRGRNFVIQQLKRNSNHQIIMYDHLKMSSKTFSPLPVTRWKSTSGNLQSENIQFAVVPPNPTLLEPLSLRGIPTMIVCDESVPNETLVKLRTLAQTQPISILFNPDAEEVRIGLIPFFEQRMNKAQFIH
jgi:hypothetical protein